MAHAWTRERLHQKGLYARRCAPATLSKATSGTTKCRTPDRCRQQSAPSRALCGNINDRAAVELPVKICDFSKPIFQEKTHVREKILAFFCRRYCVRRFADDSLA